MPFTSGAGMDKSPRLSPAGDQLAFLSTWARGAPQLHLISVDGGEARQLGDFELGVTNFRWSPDGQVIYAAVA